MGIDWTAAEAAFLRFSPGPRREVRVFFAPGRVNLMGDHTDYNGGYVLPGAIEAGTYLWVRPRPGRSWRFASATEAAGVEVSAGALIPGPDLGFAAYPAGVVWALEAAGLQVPGADCFYVGDLPQGAGLSSSASLEVVTAYGLTRLAGADWDRDRLAAIAHRAENGFVGVPCGVMDQYSVALGREDHVLSLRAEPLQYEAVPVVWSGVRLVITDTQKSHHLVASPYRERRAQCDAILVQLQEAGVSVPNLAAIEPEAWDQVGALVKDPVLRRRLRHVVFENARARQAPALLREGRLFEFGQLMQASHLSLRDDYEVTGPELDALAEAAWVVPGCWGSRMTGAGFGGSTVSLVAEDALDGFRASVGESYRARIGYNPRFIVTRLHDGVGEVTGR
jgi:galactokinase